MLETPIRSKKNKKRQLIVTSLLMMLVLTFLLVSTVGMIYLYPAFQQEQLNATGNVEIYYMGDKIQYTAIEMDGQLYLPFDFIREYVDPTIHWDEKEEVAIITTNTDVFHFPFGKTEGLLNLEPYSFTYPMVKDGDVVYLPVDPIIHYYHLKLNFVANDSILIVHDLTKPIQQGIVLERTKLRKQPTWNSPWLAEADLNQNLYIMHETSGWYWVETEQGLMGFMDKDKVQLTGIKTNEIKKEVYQPWNPIGEPIVLTWEYATNFTVNLDQIGELTGLHVVSPTWFHLQKNGLVTNKADMPYVDWAHKKGFQVWALFSNSFDPDLTHDMLSDSLKRTKVIKQLLSYVDFYQLDGINIDFENVYVKDKELLVQFIRELTPLLHEKDRTVSMDVTFKSKSENWSMFYDREKLGEIVDYLIVMGYDEHWASSPKAGSVASLPWVEKGIKALLQEVSNEKIILGVPFYTRLWIEEEDDDGKIRVSSKAMTMNQIERWIKENNVKIQYDKVSGQNYVEKKDGNIIYKIWIEDELSMENRVNLMKKYRLAGIAAWRRGFEHDEFWPALAKMIEKRP